MAAATDYAARVGAIPAHRPWWRGRFGLVVLVVFGMFVGFLAWKKEYPWPDSLVWNSLPGYLDRFQTWLSDSRNAAQSVTLLEAIAEFGFDAAIGGARRDEEKARAKERVFSFRDEFGQWDPRNQRPELWSLYNARVHPDEHVRVFPISNWTELDVWQYIAREAIDLPSIYYAHRRPVVRRRGLLVAVTSLTPARAGEAVEELSVRFRTVGDVSCTCPVESAAGSVEAIVQETVSATLTERGATRMDDQTSEASMERRKKQGYF